MRKQLEILAAVAIVAAPAPAIGQAASFTLVNNTTINFTAVQVRRFGTAQWLPLVVAPVPVTASGGQGAVQFDDPDCAFDLAAALPDGRQVIWSGVNLCDARIVTLNQNARGDLWVDYR